MSFKEKFLKLPPGKERDNLVYQAIISQGPPKNLVPITVPGPNGSKLTYYVMPDYISVENIRVPITGEMAQKIANHFNMVLPTTKIDKQIWENAKTKLKPTPMSGGAVIGGKYYTGQEVVSSKINTSDTSVAFNEKINQQLKDKDTSLVAGHMKSIVQPDDPNRLGLTGWYHPDGTPIQKGNISSHDTTQHSEYAAGLRLMANKVTITLPNGQIITDTMENILKNPQYYSAINTSKGLKTYKVQDDKTKKEKIDSITKQDNPIDKVKEDLKITEIKPVEKPNSGTKGILDKIYTYFKDITSKIPSF